MAWLRAYCLPVERSGRVPPFWAYPLAVMLPLFLVPLNFVLASRLWLIPMLQGEPHPALHFPPITAGGAAFRHVRIVNLLPYSWFCPSRHRRYTEPGKAFKAASRSRMTSGSGCREASCRAVRNSLVFLKLPANGFLHLRFTSAP